MKDNQRTLRVLAKRATEGMRRYLIQWVLFSLVVSWLLISGFEVWIERGVSNANITTYGKALWWGIVTFLTVGYGDYYPVTPFGKFWASLLMCQGVLSVTIITSKISSYFLAQILREGRGFVKGTQLKGHFIICGWKEEMHQLLNHILDFNPNLNSKDLVLIANISDDSRNTLLEMDRFKGLQFIIGNYYEAAQLSKACPEKARKILILADRTPDRNGVVPGQSEIDSRTIITAMTLSNLARGTQVTAEILDSKMDQYLKMASVSEVIYSREYSRLLLGNAAGGTGVANIIFELLDPRNPTCIASVEIPEGDVGLTYVKIKESIESQRKDCVVIGILENTGNSHSIKEQALREAQKTPDMAKLVENLKSIKQLKCNHPVFHPDDNYLVPLGAMVIVIETRRKSGQSSSDADQHDNQQYPVPNYA